MLASLSSTGCCRVLGLAYRTTRGEPSIYCDNCDQRRSLALYSTWADEAWMQEAGACGGGASPDYAAGFHDGFVDYVYGGGSGEPPPVPPRRYWNAGLRLPEGKARAGDWFAGFRHGARVARDNGYREMGTVRGMLAGDPRAAHHAETYALPAETDPPTIQPYQEPANPFSSEDPIESLPTPTRSIGPNGPVMPPPVDGSAPTPPQSTPAEDLPPQNDDQLSPPPIGDENSATTTHKLSRRTQTAASPAPAELELPPDVDQPLPMQRPDQGWKPVSSSGECSQTTSTTQHPSKTPGPRLAVEPQQPDPKGTSLRIVTSNEVSEQSQDEAITPASFVEITDDGGELHQATTAGRMDSTIARDLAPVPIRECRRSKADTLNFKR